MTGNIRAQHDIKFKHLSIKDGLSQSTVLCILEDKNGFIWFGTRDGLNRYDGYTFTVYRHNIHDSTSISSNHVQALYEDSQGNLWVGTNGGGLNLYDRSRNAFTHYRHLYTDEHSLSTDAVTSISEDRRGNLWVGTYWGLNLLDRKSGHFTRFIHNDTEFTHLSSNSVLALITDRTGNIWIGTAEGLNLYSHERKVFKWYQQQNDYSGLTNNIRALLEDRQGNIWMGTANGLNRFNPLTQTFTPFTHDPSNTASISNNSIFSLEEDANGNIWIGTEQGGLNVFNPKNGTFTAYQNNASDDGTISQNSVPSLLIDRQGIVWIGTYAAGINKYDINVNAFTHYRQDITGKSTNSLMNNTVTSFVETEDGHIWVGTDGGGINVLDKKTSQFTYHTPYYSQLNSYSILCLLRDKDGDIWVGTYSNGLNRLSRKTNTFTYYQKNDTPGGLSSNSIYALLEDRKGFIWMATNDGGVNRLDKNTSTVTRYLNNPSDPNSLSNNCIRAIYEDRQGNIWMGTYGGGVDLFHPETHSFTHFTNSNSGLSSNVVFCIFEDSRQNLLVGTEGGGLNLFDKKSGTFTAIRETEGLSNDVVNAITEDNQGYLWITTNRGITRYHPQHKSFKYFDIHDGLQSYEFVRGAALKGRNGELYFGGINGFNVIDPDHLKENTQAPAVLLTDFLLFNKSVPIGEDSPLRQHISETSELTLAYDQSVFTFDFVAMNFTLSERNQYAYKMQGFDKDWNYIGTKHSATYTNLDPGEYVFEVRAANNDGIWNENGTFIKILINPPFWKTWWFRLLIVLSIMGSTATFFLIRMRAISAQKAELEKQVRERTAEVVQQKEELQTQAEFLQSMNEELRESREEVQVQRDNLQAMNEQVMSSIRYAKTIQKALLPSERKIEQYVSDHFILYRPKDVVSGDFYWFSHLTKDELPGEESELTFIAAIDCTGHGVPGAFMSIIGNTLLNEIVNIKHILDPAQVLEQLDKGMKHAVEKAEGINTAGMDVCLIRLQKGEARQVRLLFSGAKRSLLFVRKGFQEVDILEADRRSIGSHSKSERPFTTQELLIEAGTVLYLTSDGYADQNNPDRIKLGSARLKQLINQIATLPLREQKIAFEQALDAHQQTAQQRDDITLLGIRI